MADEAILRVSAIPDEAPTSMKVVFTPVTDYAAVVESLATKKIDLAWLRRQMR